MRRGGCPKCNGTGRVTRPPNPNGTQSPFMQLCPRCQGLGEASLTEDEKAIDFSGKANRAMDTAQRRPVPSGDRGFRSGVMDTEQVRQRRDEIRQAEGRRPPPAEPAPIAPVTEAIKEAASNSKCPCGLATGDCNGQCAG